MKIAPEGGPFVVAAAAVWAVALLIGATVGGWWWLAAGLWTPIALWIPWFFRNPDRDGPRGDHLVIAPADGRVVSVAEVEEPTVIGGGAVRISVFMNVFDVHVNRHPVSGTVTLREYEPGAFVNATLDKASALNERATVGISSPRGPVVVRQIAGLVARRIVTDPLVGAAVVQGERLGIIRFGSRVDTFLPAGVRVLVRNGERTLAGVTPIAEWP